jgi:hypothetical protein
MPSSIQQALTEVERKMREVIQSLGNNCDFELRGTAPAVTFTVKGTLAGRSEDDLTAGLDQDVRWLTIAARDWNAASPGRPPSKGDLVTVEGHRHRVMDTVLDAAGNVQIRWRLMVKG